jgi:hypothetical protein
MHYTIIAIVHCMGGVGTGGVTPFPHEIRPTPHLSCYAWRAAPSPLRAGVRREQNGFCRMYMRLTHNHAIIA